MKDTDGDGKADVKKDHHGWYPRGLDIMRAEHLRYGLDNYIWAWSVWRIQRHIQWQAPSLFAGVYRLSQTHITRIRPLHQQQHLGHRL